MLKAGEAGVKMAEQVLRGEPADAEDGRQDAFEILQALLEGPEMDLSIRGRGARVVEEEVLDQALAVVRREPGEDEREPRLEVASRGLVGGAALLVDQCGDRVGKGATGRIGGAGGADRVGVDHPVVAEPGEGLAHGALDGGDLVFGGGIEIGRPVLEAGEERAVFVGDDPWSDERSPGEEIGDGEGVLAPAGHGRSQRWRSNVGRWRRGRVRVRLRGIEGLEAQRSNVEVEALSVALRGLLEERVDDEEDERGERDGLEVDADGEEEDGEEAAFENREAPLDTGDEDRRDQ